MKRGDVIRVGEGFEVRYQSKRAVRIHYEDDTPTLTLTSADGDFDHSDDHLDQVVNAAEVHRREYRMVAG